MIKNKIKNTFVFIVLVMIVLLNPLKIQAQVTGQLYLTGPTSVHYGDVVSYSLKDAQYNDTPSSSQYNNFNWTVLNNGTVLTSVNESYQTDIEVYWDGNPSQEKVYVLYASRSDSYQYYAELNVTVLPTPSVPDAPTVLSSSCNQVVLKRNDPPGNIRTGGQDITWYWQSTPTGTSTANSASTITLTSGTVYYLRARRSNGVWSDGASSVQYIIGVPAPIVTTVYQPTITTPTGSVLLSGLPETGTWIINPGNISGSGYTKTITGLTPSTTYSFTVTNSSGCISPTSANVVINAQSSTLDAPVLSSVKQPNCITPKGEFTITNYNPSYTYTATPSTGVSFLGVKVLAPQGNYTIKAVSGTTTSPASAIVTINAQPTTPSAPIVGTITHPTLTTVTGSVQLSGLPSSSWIINPGNISGSGITTTITGLKAGVAHNLTVTNSSGCISAPSANIVINLQPFVCSGISDENYVYTIIPQIETTDITSLTVGQKQESITYYDGIGRPKQKIAIKGGGLNSKDIITHIGYDDFGRQTKEYLPYTDGNDCGAFRTADIDLATKTYYKTNYPSDINTTTPNPYSEKDIELSPLNRVLRQAAPGYDWRLNGDHEIKMGYQVSKDEDLVKLYNVEFVLTNNTYVPTLRNNGYYSNTLYKNIIYDENTASNPTEINGSVVEFKNKEGQVILKRSYGTVGTGTVNEKHDTYYVYDDFGNLSFVIPPKAIDLFDSANIDLNVESSVKVEPAASLQLKAANSIVLKDGFNAKAGSTFSAVIDNSNQTVLDHLCYQYKYDKRNRLIEKKLPGKEWEYIIYDKLDRPILTQDANLRTNKKWIFTKYDVFSRPVYTGEYTNTVKITRADMQTFADSSTAFFETKQAANTINGTTLYYTNNAFPNINDTNINLFTINYYDDYNFDVIPADISSIGASTKTKGLSTGNKIRILYTNNWITNWNYYDNKSLPIYNYSKNDYLITTDIIKNQYDFVGKITQTTTTHTRNAVTTTIVDVFTYDQAGRLTKQTQAINGATFPEVIAANTYDQLGQLASKAVGGKSNQSRLQTIDYKYNVRGWLKNINDINAIGTDLFAFQINYNDITDATKKLFNGNISQTYWKTANSDSSLKNYVYIYDKLNRLKDAFDNLGKFNETINYDKNGNIIGLVRLGEIVGGSTIPNINTPSHFGTMDNLLYTYDKGNKLQIVSDSGNDTYGFQDDFIGTGADTTTDYTYDANGNMKTDTNKGITAITYNYLNLPDQITIGGQNINYYYDAAGTKQRKVVNGITTDYAGDFIYEAGQLKFFSQPEGYISYNSGTFDYIYQYKDHLGNVRLSYDKNLVIQEENNYYPFGLKHKGYNLTTNLTTGNSKAQKYKYNGKELQDELGLNMYDYGARNYDPALGRWMNIDPLAEKMKRHSPYNYAFNNPMRFTDPDGMSPDDIIFRGKNGNKITIKTSGEDKVVNLPFDIAKNKTLDIGIGNIDPNRFVYGYTVQADIGFSAIGGAQWGGEITVANFTDNKYSGYSYVYAGGHVNKTIGYQVSIGASVGGSIFVGYNDSKAPINPSSFAGNSYTYNASMDIKAILGGGISIGSFSSVSNPITQQGWKGFTVGVNVGVGESANLGAIGRQDSFTYLVNDIKPTSERSFSDRMSNAVAPIPSSIIKATYDALNSN